MRSSPRLPTAGMNCVFGLAGGLLVCGLAATGIAGQTALSGVPELDTSGFATFTAVYVSSAAITTFITVLIYRAARSKGRHVRLLGSWQGPVARRAR